MVYPATCFQVDLRTTGTCWSTECVVTLGRYTAYGAAAALTCVHAPLSLRPLGRLRRPVRLNLHPKILGEVVHGNQCEQHWHHW
eukprot:5800388-Prymnesium_polylepis.1